MKYDKKLARSESESEDESAPRQTTGERSEWLAEQLWKKGERRAA